MVISTIKDLLVPLGIEKYTIHPHFNRSIYEALSPDEKKRMLSNMGNYFADLVLSGASLARIDNMQDRKEEVEKWIQHFKDE